MPRTAIGAIAGATVPGWAPKRERLMREEMYHQVAGRTLWIATVPKSWCVSFSK
jgi:hypothetical protein